MYNIIGGGNIVGELIPFALPRSSNLSTVSYFQKVTSDASKMSAINVAVRQSSSGATLPDEYVFGSQLALVWTWDISLNGQDSVSVVDCLLLCVHPVSCVFTSSHRCTCLSLNATVLYSQTSLPQPVVHWLCIACCCSHIVVVTSVFCSATSETVPNMCVAVERVMLYPVTL